MNIMNSKFGKVFLLRKTTEMKLESLSDAHVSNVDLKWYDNNGNIHELFENHIGKSVSLQFTFSVKDKNNQVCTQLMTLLLPDKLGCFPEPNRELLQDGHKIVADVAHRSGYTHENSKRLLKSAEAAGLIALTGVGKVAEDIKIHTAMLAGFIWDDFLDKECPQDFRRYEKLSEIINYMVGIIRGKEELYDHMHEDSIDLINTHKGYFQLVRTEALRAAQKWDCSPDPCLEEMEKYMDACKLEACIEWNTGRNQDSELFHRVQKANRELTVGIFVAMETFALAEGIQISNSIRNNLVFQTFRRLVVEHAAKTNDLVSFEREYANGETSNNLYIFHVVHGLSMEESMTRIQKELNSATAALVEAGEFLTRLYPEEKMLERYVQLGKAVVTGMLLWCGYSKRYCPNLVYDMVVH